MEDKHIDQIADKVAAKVIALLIEQQKIWDEQVLTNLDPANMNVTYEYISPKEDLKSKLLEELDILRLLNKKHLEDEDYLKVAEVTKRITKLENKINNL